MSQSVPFGHSASRDRLLAFAFAAADLLLEVGPNGTITWAAGAFKTHFGRPAETFIGRQLVSLIKPADQDALTRTLINVSLHGHTPPVLLRLNDPAATQYSLGAMLLPGPNPRLCVTLGPLPTSPPPKPSGMLRAASFAREAEARARANQASTLGLLDLRGWDAAPTDADGTALREEIGLALGSLAGGGGAVGELADGRYGVLSQRQLDIDALAASMQSLLRSRSDTREMTVRARATDMAGQGLKPAQATRALRFALSKFTEGGVERLDGSGIAGGLAGVVKHIKGMTSALRRVISQGEFDVVFQPVVMLSSRGLHHYEALLRPPTGTGATWESTQDFVVCAEAMGLAEQLDLAVLERVLTALTHNPACKIAANISGLSMQSTEFREKLLAALPSGRYQRLLIELTETAEIEDVPAAAQTLERLHELNIGLCIDDFGAGAAAFRYVRDFRVDYLKIDGAYVQGAVRDERERALVSSMLDLARSVGAKTIAEMIETNEQARLMEQLGATLGQGWLFGLPGALPP
jgi:EAL domain-containing protein (putative c-di-GMP-specific phosphodiesterase class I)